MRLGRNMYFVAHTLSVGMLIDRCSLQVQAVAKKWFCRYVGFSGAAGRTGVITH